MIKKVHNFYQNHKLILFFLCLILCLIIVILLPIFQVGYVADNSWLHNISTSNYWQQFIDKFLSLPTNIGTQINAGRLNLTSVFIGILDFNFIYLGLPIVHFSTIVQTILSVVIFAIFIKKLTKNNSFVLLALFLVPLFFQIRPYHDPFIVFLGNFQFFLSLFLLSMCFLIDFLEQKTKISAFLSILFFFFAVEGHEANVVWLACALLIFWTVERKIWSRKIWPFLFYLLSCLFAYFSAPFLQWLFGIEKQTFAYQGTELSFSLVEVIKTFFIQIIAALPLSSFFGRVGQESIAYYPHLFLDQLPVFFLALIAFTFSACLFWKSKLLTKKISFNLNYFLTLLLGFSLWLLPALPVALSNKYQIDLALFGLKSGTGYILVYYQYFGVVIILASFLLGLFSLIKYKKTLLTILTITASAIFYLTYCNNIATVKQINKAYDEHLYLFNQVVKTDFFNDLPKEINLIFNERVTNYYHVNGGYDALFSIWTEEYLTKFTSFNEIYNSSNMEANYINANNLPTYFIYYDQVDEFSGYIILAPVIKWQDGLILSNEAKIFYLSSYVNNNFPSNIYPALRRDLFVSYYVLNKNDEIEFKNYREWFVRPENSNYAIVEINDEDLILIDSIVPALTQDDRQSFDIVAPVK